MKLASNIHRVPVNHRGDWLFVSLSDDAGNTGWGEASHSGNDDHATERLVTLGKALCAAVSQDEQLLLPPAPWPATDKPLQTAISALEMACQDLFARRNKQAVSDLLAAGTDQISKRVDVYANINRMCADRTPAGIAAAAKMAMQSGVTRMKFAPFDEVTPDKLDAASDPMTLVSAGADRLLALRAAVGPDITLMVDCHWRFTAGTLPLLADVINQCNACWIEDPFPVLERSLADQLRARTGALIAGGEALVHQAEFEQYVRDAGADVLIADVKHVGGIRPLDALCKLAAKFDMQFAPHNPSGPVSTAASAHVVAANANAHLLEFAFGEVAWRAQLGVGERCDGQSIEVDGPGLGVHIDLAAPLR